jgi:predicted metalloendopeptidase
LLAKAWGDSRLAPSSIAASSRAGERRAAGPEPGLREAETFGISCEPVMLSPRRLLLHTAAGRAKHGQPPAPNRNPPAAFLASILFFLETPLDLTLSRHRSATRPRLWAGLSAAALLASPLALHAQQPAAPAPAPVTHYTAAPAFDLSSMDKTANPCDDFYKFACGNFAANHPIPPDQADVDQFYLLMNVNTERLNNILTKYEQPDPNRTPNQQKIGDYYAACMNTPLIEQKDLTPVQPLLTQIDKVSLPGLAYLTGELQRIGVNAFFSFGEGQDYKDSTKQVAQLDQGGLGLPDRDYYTRSGDKDKEIRQQYVAHIASMLSYLGETPQQASTDAQNILGFETKLANASMTIAQRRDPEATYHPETLAEFEASVKPMPFAQFLEAVHSPQVSSVVNSNPGFFPAMIGAIRSTDLQTLRAYLRYELITTFAANLPKRIDAENFKFYGTELSGQPEQRPRWKRCSSAVDGALGEALGQVYVSDYFAGESKAHTLEMVHDIEAAMDHDIDTLDWMSPETKVKAKAKLALVANKIGYPDKWRDYSRLVVAPDDAFGNQLRATAFENDRELHKIGQPVDKQEWGMTPPTVNAYYNPSMNDINFPAGILQPAFYDAASSDIAVNYGHIGAVIGHELTHGFDDQGAKFNGEGNMLNWWTPEDKSKFEARTGCLVKEYSNITAIDDLKVAGDRTLGENTADNGGVLLAYMAYLDRAKKEGLDTAATKDGFTGPQRFYIAYAQNWCENTRPAYARELQAVDVHSPDKVRVNGVLVNQPGFGPAFGCKTGTPMVPASNCRVW